MKFLLVFAAFVFIACSHNEKPAELSKEEEKTAPVRKKRPVKPPEFSLTPDSSRIIVATEEVTLRENGPAQYLVFYRDTSDHVFPYTEYSDVFHYIDLYSRRENKFVLSAKETVNYGINAEYVDVNNDSAKEIIIHTSSGGNNSVTSEGLIIFSSQKEGGLTKIFERRDGRPELSDIDSDKTVEIFAHGEYVGQLPHSLVIEYISSIYTFHDGMYVRSHDTHLAQLAMNDEFENAKKLYERIRMPSNDSVVTDALHRYRAMARILVLAYAMGDAHLAATFWNLENESFRQRIPEEYLLELETLARLGIEKPGGSSNRK